MQNNYHYNLEISDILEKPKNNSSVSTQILFGEKFKILKQHKKFFKIKLINDNYSGYLKKQKFLVNYKPTHKIGKLKSLYLNYLKVEDLHIQKNIYFY